MSLTHVRLATKDEIEKIRATADFAAQTVVFAMDQHAGEPDIAVVKTVVELDPVYFGKESNDHQKARFIYALEERMAGGGIDSYYSNIDATDARWLKVLLNWGYEQVSPQPEIRLKRVLGK